MRAVFLIVFFIVSFGSSLLFAAKWSEWKDLTQCTAKPCKCPGPDKKKGCVKGTKVQIRTCIREEGDTDICKWGKHGPIKLNEECRNKNVCPGWSEWIPEGPCDCKTETQTFIRLCNSPPPIHHDVKCVNENTGEQMVKSDDVRKCSCTEEQKRKQQPTTTTTTTTPVPSTTPLECCVDDYDYDEGENDGDALDGGALDGGLGATTTSGPTTKKSDFDKMYDEMYDDFFKSKGENEECRPCENATDSGGDSGSNYDYY